MLVSAKIYKILFFLFLLIFSNQLKANQICTEDKSIGFLNDKAVAFYKDENFSEAFLCYKALADKGDYLGIENTSEFYLKGIGTHPDISAAVEYANSMYNLHNTIYMYLRISEIVRQEEDIFNLPEHLKLSFEMVKIAVELGEDDNFYDYAVTEFAYHNMYGIGTESNYEEAFKWYSLGAELNNVIAQSNLGWMYAGGRGTEMDYEKGLEWTLKAAESNEVFALGNLAWHYEFGLGVDEDLDEAIKFYTEAAKLGSDYAIGRLKTLGAYNENLLNNETSVAQTDNNETFKDEINFGNYYALVIGNNNYENLPKLNTAVNDATKVAKILEDNYNFNVTLLVDQKHDEMKDAIFEIRSQMQPFDNLLIYYAGHGELDNDEERGYWLPIDADTTKRSKWINNSYILDNIKATKAKHVLLISDSCFSGSLMRGKQKLNLTKDIAKVVSKKTRVVITSAGGDEPAVDSGENNHSVFANALINTLKENNSIVLSDDLFPNIRKYVINNADQVPEMSVLLKAGHDGGDFIFVPN